MLLLLLSFFTVCNLSHMKSSTFQAYSCCTHSSTARATIRKALVNSLRNPRTLKVSAYLPQQALKH